MDCPRELRGLLCSSCRTDYANYTLAIVLRGLRGTDGLQTNLCTTKLFLLTKRTSYVDYVDETIIRAYAKLRPAGRGYTGSLAESLPS